MSTNLKKTPFFNLHLSQKAKMVEFNGYLMPVQYSSIVAEHLWVRESCGIFDVSHMGKFNIIGLDALKFLDFIVPTKIIDKKISRVIYSAVLKEDASPVDDITLYKTAPEEWLLVVNAGNRDKLKDYLMGLIPKYDDLFFRDVTEAHQQIAVQGPLSADVMKDLFQSKYIEIPYYHFSLIDFRGQKIILSRTGYTGEDGFEIYGTFEILAYIWKELLKDPRVKPIGLGARDSLRLEARYPLYGHELNEGWDLLQSGLGWIIHWEKEEFIGKEILVKRKTEGLPRKLYGFILEEEGIPRQNCQIVDKDANPKGIVTSGGYSPSLKKGIMLAMVDSDAPDELFVAIRDKIKKISKIKGPFIPNRTLKGKAGLE